jgi:hypothetical protein
MATVDGNNHKLFGAFWVRSGFEDEGDRSSSIATGDGYG